MPIDASIPLGIKTPDQMQSLSSLLTAAKGAQDVQAGGIALREKQGLQQVMADPSNYTDENGNIDTEKARKNIMAVAPTTGIPVLQGLLTAQKQHTEAQSALSTLGDQDRTRVANVLSTLKPDTAPDVVNGTVDALNKEYKGRIAPMVNLFKQGYANAVKQGPQAVEQLFATATRSVLPQTTQAELNTPTGVAVSDGQTARVVNVKPGVQGMPQGATVPGTEVTNKVGPAGLESVDTDAQGNRFIVSRTPSGAIVGTRPLDSATPAAPGPFRLPPGETQQSMGDLQQQRTAAHTVANSAPVMHDINRTIIAEASKGLNTGKLGELTQKLSSYTGYTIGKDEATDYNLLGKMLERSALTAAQSMGPHTNAGLEASIRANGSLEYTPQAIKKIAHLNDAIVSGSELYREGMEKAIGSSPDSIFAKRNFDTHWAKVATPQVLRLKNAVDNGDKEEIESISKEVGGRGSDGARKLHKQLTELLQLTGR